MELIHQHTMTYRNDPEINTDNFTMNNAIMLRRNTTNSKKGTTTQQGQSSR
jgi:hypothetical protein